MNELLQVVPLVVMAGFCAWAISQVRQSNATALEAVTEITNTALKATAPPSDAQVDHMDGALEQVSPLPPADQVDWDPTDAAFGLADPEFGEYVPRFGNDPRPIVTHPLGIPGLTIPYPTIVGDPEYSGGPT